MRITLPPHWFTVVFSWPRSVNVLAVYDLICGSWECDDVIYVLVCHDLGAGCVH